MERVDDYLIKDPDRLRLNESKDCTVRAWSYVFNAPYIVSHRFLESCGRVRRRGMTREASLAAFSKCKKIKWRLGPYSMDNRITLSEFCKKHPTGRYYIGCRGHAFAVIDGVVYDHKDSPRRQVTRAIRVYLEGEI